jgi:hypothetical protein
MYKAAVWRYAAPYECTGGIRMAPNALQILVPQLTKVAGDFGVSFAAPYQFWRRMSAQAAYGWLHNAFHHGHDFCASPYKGSWQFWLCLCCTLPVLMYVCNGCMFDSRQHVLQVFVSCAICSWQQCRTV